LKRVINFLKFRYIALGVSVLLFIVFTSGTIAQGGFNFGIDFVGGVKIIAKFEKSVKEKDIRNALVKYKPLVQQIGEDSLNEYIISTKLKEGDKGSENSLEDVKKILSTAFSDIEFLSEENVGPAIGDILKKDAIKLFLVAMILMTIYLSFRFEFKYSVGTMAAIVHDIALSVGFIGFTGVEMNVPVVAALLTIFGYSVNDTIVIFDRIRENVQVKSKMTFLDTINKGISQSINRTLLTSLTTLFAVLALYLLGGAGLNEFAMVLLFGIFVGTYSSLYIASPILVSWEKRFSK